MTEQQQTAPMGPERIAEIRARVEAAERRAVALEAERDALREAIAHAPQPAAWAPAPTGHGALLICAICHRPIHAHDNGCLWVRWQQEALAGAEGEED